MTNLPRGARCATHMTASASCERDSAPGRHRASQHAARDRLRRPRGDRGGAGMGGRQQRLLWLDIPHGRVRRFDPVDRQRRRLRCGQAGRCGRPAHRKDQSEWQIEWQTEHAWARPVLANAGLCSCSRSSDGRSMPAVNTRPPAYIAELWVSAPLRERIQRVLADDQAGPPRTCEPDVVAAARSGCRTVTTTSNHPITRLAGLIAHHRRRSSDRLHESGDAVAKTERMRTSR